MPLLYQKKRIIDVNIEGNNISESLQKRLKHYLQLVGTAPEGSNTSQPLSEIPEEFFCSITGQLMADPVLLIDTGHSYEREAIERWLSTKKSDPMTNLAITNTTISPNIALRKMINTFLERNRNNAQIINQLYAPNARIQDTIENLAKDEPQAFAELLNIETRLLIKELKEGKNLLQLACEQASLAHLQLILSKLSNELWNLACVNEDNGSALITDVAKRLGLAGTKLLAEALQWEVADFNNWLKFCCDKDDVKMAEIALKLGATVTNKLLVTACKRNQIALLRVLLASGPELGDLLAQVIKDGQLAILEVLLSESQVNIHLLDAKGDSFLHHAARMGYTEIAVRLIQQGALLKLKNHNGETAIDVATQAGHLQLINAMQEAYRHQKLKPYLESLEQKIAMQQRQLEAQQKVFSTLGKHASLFKNALTKVKKLSIRCDGNSFLVLPNGNIVTAVEYQLKVWNLDSQQCIQTLSGHTSYISCLALLNDGRVLSGSSDKSLKIWDLATGQCLQTFIGHREGITCVSGIDEGLIASGSYDKTIKLWSITSGQCLKTLILSDNNNLRSIHWICMLASGKIAAGIDDNRYDTRIWDIESGQYIRNISIDNIKHKNKYIVMPDNRLVTYFQNEIYVLNNQTFEKSFSLPGHDKIYCKDNLGRNNITDIALFEKDKIIAGYGDGRLKVWDINAKQCLQTMEAESIVNNEIYCIARLPDRRIICKAGGSIYIWSNSVLDVVQQVETELQQEVPECNLM